MRRRELIARVIVSALGVPYMLWLTYEGGWIAWWPAYIASIIIVWEYSALAKDRFLERFFCGAYVVTATFVLYDKLGIRLEPILLFPLPFAVFLSVLFWPRKSWLGTLEGLGGGLYVGLPFFWLYSWHDSPGWPFIWACLISTWTNDTMSYVWGKLLGKTPFVPRISPGKTWEGAIGGIATTALVGGIAFNWATGWGFLPSFLFAGSYAVAGTVGDLFESALKREANVKDSGFVLPGHGGLFDRFDAFVMSMWFAYLLLKIIGGM